MHQLPALRILQIPTAVASAQPHAGASVDKEGPGGGGKAEPEECALGGCDADITRHRLRQHLGALQPSVMNHEPE